MPFRRSCGAVRWRATAGSITAFPVAGFLIFSLCAAWRCPGASAALFAKKKGRLAGRKWRSQSVSSPLLTLGSDDDWESAHEWTSASGTLVFSC